jgi:hypothetical protein
LKKINKNQQKTDFIKVRFFAQKIQNKSLIILLQTKFFYVKIKRLNYYKGGTMNNIQKRMKTFVVSMLAFVLMISFMPLNVFTIKNYLAVSATEQGSLASGYFYNQLTADAKKFYQAIAQMNADGLLKQGNAEYDLISSKTLSKSQINSYSQNADVMLAFGAGRDAYRLDHPELFYVDFDYLSVSVGTKTDGTTVATLGTGRADNYFAEGFNAQNVNEAISTFNSKVDYVVAEANKKSTEVDKIKYVNQYLIDNVKYTYALDNGDEAPNVHNAYGAVVSGTAVCEGYSYAFKVIMDKLGIECVLVSGFAAANNDGKLQAHMWNYVHITENDSNWYAVDVTWNDGDGTGLDAEGYLLVGNDTITLDHQSYGIVSNAEFEFTYPVLRTYDYGMTADSTSIQVSQVIFQESTDKYNIGLNVRYQGKSALELKQEGLYLAYRFINADSASTLDWTSWYSVEDMPVGSLEEIEYTYKDANNVQHTEKYVVTITPTAMYVQFAFVNYSTNGEMSYENLEEENIVAVSEAVANPRYGTYRAAPFLVSKTPDVDVQLDVTKTYEITLTYDVDLKIVDEESPVGVKIVTKHSDIEEYATVSNVTWSESDPRVVKFTFKASEKFQHRNDTYTFYLTNIVGKETGVVPNGVSFLVKRTDVVCDKVFSDDRLYMQVYGEPKLAGVGDLSMNGWTTEDGSKVLQNQRSQLVLVASKPSDEKSSAMEDGIVSSLGTSQSAVKACETFELELDICSQIVKIPEGSFLQLSFGFPAGYGPDDAGTTFKVYHFKTNQDGSIDYDNPEELACVITENGLIVTVNSFSPFAIVAVDSSVVSTNTKAVYASTTSKGGAVVENGISTFDDSQSIVYNFTPSEGYSVDRVLLNGVDVSNKVSGNSLTLDYADLNSNNTLEVSFVANRVVEQNEAQGITVVRPSLVASVADEAQSTNSASSVAIIVVSVVCLAGIAVAVYAFVNNSKKKKAK